ncbi:MAG: peptidoglycan -binding protein [Pseudomonadota bacterium]
MPRRRNDQGSSVIWPGFVDAMTALLLVLMFVLSIFMVVQFVLREELIGKDRSLDLLGTQLLSLQQELSSEQERASTFRSRVADLEELLAQEEERALRLGRELAETQERNVTLSAELERRIAELAVTAEALGDLQERSTRLVSIEKQNAALQETQLTLEERIAALELELDKKRAEAEETLTLLAAAEAKSRELDEAALEAAKQLTERERLNAVAQAALAAEKELTAENRQAIALLNGQIRDLREQIASLELQLRVTEQKEADAQVQIQDLGARLNKALARKVDELQRYRSEFFGRLRSLLDGRAGVQVVGDRFVFQSEILFASGSADLGAAGQAELAAFAEVLRGLAADIPDEIPWILRVDGHTDVVPIGFNSRYANNWELSQARALSVVEFLIREQDIPATRLAATGFGEHQPIATERTAEAFKRNRRIELKLTER